MEFSVCENCCYAYPLDGAPVGVMECLAFYHAEDHMMYVTGEIDIYSAAPETWIVEPQHRSNCKVVYYDDVCTNCISRSYQRYGN